MKFTEKLIADVKAHFGSEMSPRLLEAFEEGDVDFVLRFLRGSLIEPTWESVQRDNYVELQAMAHQQLRLRALLVRVLAEGAVHAWKEAVNA